MKIDFMKYERLNQKAFNNIIVDSIMKKELINEVEAEVRYFDILNIVLDNEELCEIDKNTSSLRHGLVCYLKNNGYEVA